MGVDSTLAGTISVGSLTEELLCAPCGPPPGWLEMLLCRESESCDSEWFVLKKSALWLAVRLQSDDSYPESLPDRLLPPTMGDTPDMPCAE